MEGRKVQKVGKTTLAVSLPISWVKTNKLKQGDLLIFSREEDGSLKIRPSSIVETKPRTEEFVIDSNLCDEPKMLEKLIVANYVLGREVITIFSPKRLNEAHISEVREIVPRLLGLGIIEETSSHITLQCSLDVTKFPVHVIMRRLYIIASTMLKETIQALREESPELARAAAKMEKEADTIYWLIVRLLLSAQKDKDSATRIGQENPLHIVGNRIIASHLEKISDYSEKIAESIVNIINLKGKQEKTLNLKKIIAELIQIGDTVYEICCNSMQSLYTGDVKLATSTIETFKRKIEVEEPNISDRICQVPNKDVTCILRSTSSYLFEIADLAKDIAEVAINRILETPSKICKEQTIRTEDPAV